MAGAKLDCLINHGSADDNRQFLKHVAVVVVADNVPFLHRSAPEVFSRIYPRGMYEHG